MNLILTLFLLLCFMPLPLYGQSIAVEQHLTGVTVDDVTELDAVADAISSLPVKMTVRIVFDENVNASYYQAAVDRLGEIAYLQGEILDSFYVKNYTVEQYINRVNEYLDAFGDKVDIWEIGNEVNGIWLMQENTSAETRNVVEKLEGAYQAVKDRGYPAALTLYYNGIYNNGEGHATDNCWSVPSEHMTTWAKANLPADMKKGLDYVWVSYYEQDCLDYQPDWQAVMEEVAAIFPNAKIGIGECGSKNNLEQATGEEEEFITRYYVELDVDHSRYRGGYFWWYFNRDMVPKSKPLWSYFSQTLQSQKDGETSDTDSDSSSGRSSNCFVSNIYMNKGRVSHDQPFSVLDVKEQEGSYDDWDTYRQFFEAQCGRLAAVITFDVPEDIDPSDCSSAKLLTNFKSSDYDHQKWLFKVRNFTTQKWVEIGDNKDVAYWVWSDLEFSLPGDIKQYINKCNKMKLKLISPANTHKENAQIDYLTIQLAP